MCTHITILCRQSERDLKVQVRRLQQKNRQQRDKLNILSKKNAGRNKIFNGLNNDKLRFEATKRKIDKAYPFKETYNGDPGEPALRFRRAIIAFDTRVSNRLGDLYSEDEV